MMDILLRCFASGGPEKKRAFWIEIACPILDRMAESDIS